MVVFESNGLGMSMALRWEAATERLSRSGDGTDVPGSRFRLRPYQAAAFSEFSSLLQEGLGSRYLRMVLPPRSGKTVIVGQIARAAQVGTLFVVPTLDLLDQTIQRLYEQLSDVEIVPHHGQDKQTTKGGITVTTYDQVAAYFDQGEMPPELAGVALVVLDEAHHVLTERRLASLEKLFDPQVIFLAITASPDWTESRQLMAKFPILVYELGILEAASLNILAKATAYVHEVDVGTRVIQIEGADYSEKELEKAVLAQAFMEKVRSLRYDDPKTRSLGTMVCCVTMDQARAITKMLNKYRPEGIAPAECLTYDLSLKTRREIRSRFSDGHTGTIVQVGILIEGWDEPKCKMLIDTAATDSLVRATQKFYRPLTVDGDARAVIHMLVPSGLAGNPVFPTDVLYHESDPSKPFIYGKRRGRRPKPIGSWTKQSGPAFSGSVTVRSRIITCATLDRPLLRRSSKSDVREVLKTVAGFDPEHPPIMRDFFRMQVSHLLFRGSGRYLMSHLGVPITGIGYRMWLVRLFPGLVPKRFLEDSGEVLDDRSCRDDVRILREIARRIDWRWHVMDQYKRRDLKDGITSAWRAMRGGVDDPVFGLYPQEVALLHRQRVAMMRAVVAEIGDGRERSVLSLFYGLRGHKETSIVDLAKEWGCTRTNIDRILRDALHSIQKRSHVFYRRKIDDAADDGDVTEVGETVRFYLEDLY